MNRRYGPIRLPAEFLSEMARNWTIGGAVGRCGDSWHLVEVWSVLPA